MRFICQNKKCKKSFSPPKVTCPYCGTTHKFANGLKDLTKLNSDFSLKMAIEKRIPPDIL